MGTTINTNVSSLTAQRNLSASQSSLATSMQRLSSGMRVNSAKDDAAGLAIAERMNTQVKGMNVAIRNASDAISLSQTAEGALGKVADALQRMRELAVQSANATNSDGDRLNLDAEYQALNDEVTRVLTGTKFNGSAVLDTAGTLDFQVGANNSATDQISVTTTQLTAGTGVSAVTGGSITTAAASLTAMDDIDDALTEISTARASFGATQNRFEAVISNLQVNAENQAASRGRIVDADFAAETANLSRTQVLQQAGMAMVAQANAMPNGVMQLLRG
ncbi:MAG: flagellin FliC [Rhodocyclaceae bacterium]|jgi:flagellin|nr:flagellin FliC [Rhodocyclaceae bacterium]MCA3020693.1 flagellin FliC [Rhodocyclaceae bacterium]MCA3026674.1 flagellin FliC [Rhodocyclaceae bacterium]MCA3029567.1 flagellin FliC [Rhodocyclaceae bacterium]MCA3031366.1 flagellin FliC [Rhodocyclaceae bacterium]